MANYLYRRMNRELRKIKYRAVGSAVLIIISVAIYVAFSAMIPIAGGALENKVEELQLSDYLIHVNSANETDIDDIRAIQGVDTVEGRAQLASRLGYDKGGKEKEVAALVFGLDPVQRPTINMIELFGDDSRYFQGNGSGTILLERNFADTVGLEVGDTVTVITNLGKQSLDVIGLVMTPEYLFLPINPQSLMPYPGNLAVGYVSIDWLREHYQLPADFYNEFSVMYQDGMNKDSIQDTINDQLAENIILFSVPKDEVYGYNLIREDLKEGENFIGLFALLLLAIAFFIVYTSFARIVQEQKREIGILRALGYSRGRVLGSYIYMAVLIGSIASILGVFIGMPFGQAMGSFYVELLIGTQLSSFVITLEAYIVGFLFGPLTAMLACLIAVWGTVTMEPQDAIRGVPRTFLKRFKRSSTKKKVGKASSLSYITRYTFKNMARHKVRTVITTMAIGGGIMLGAMSLVMVGSFQNSLEASIEEYEHWDVLAEFSYPINDTMVQSIDSPHMTETTLISRMGVEWKSENKDGLTLVLGLDDSQTLHTFNIEKGRKFRDNDEAILNKQFAEEYKIEIGDQVQLQSYNGTYDFEVVGLAQDYISMIFIDIEMMDELGGQTVYSGMYVKAASGRTKALKEDLLSSPLVSDAQTRAGAKGGLFEYMESYYSLMYVMTLLGVAVAAPTLANIVFVSVLERYPEYGQLRAIGYSKGSIAKSILLELMIIVTVGAIFGAPFTYAFIVGYEASFQAFFPTYRTILYLKDWAGYFITVALIYLIAFLAAAPSIKKVNKMDITSVVAGGRFG